MLAVISLGGALGALCRYGLDHLIAPGAVYPWATFAVNVSGCLAIGVLMVLLVEAGPVHRLLRPFLGVGFLGGYTTFSTYAVDAHRLVDDGRPGLALAYVFGTLIAALVAVALGTALARAVVQRPVEPEEGG